MAVLIEAISVVVKNSALDERFPNGVAGFQHSAPNGTYRTDGTLSCVSFMVLDDAKSYTEVLTRHGLDASMDMAIVDQRAGFLSECNWLAIDLRTFIDDHARCFGATIAWVGDEEPDRFAARAGWRPDGLETMSIEDLEQHYEPVRVHRRPGLPGAVVAYRHRVTGRLLYIGRPDLTGSTDGQLRYVALANELPALLAMPISTSRDNALGAFLDRATALVEYGNYREAGPLLLQGIGARVLRRWSMAEQSFRLVTELRPDLLDGWLELTWALATLDRLDDAEASAKRAVEIDGNSAAALGNLANVMVQRGNAEEARPIITRAIALDPSDTKNQMILQKVQGALRPAAEPETDVPWHKRWFR